MLLGRVVRSDHGAFQHNQRREFACHSKIQACEIAHCQGPALPGPDYQSASMSMPTSSKICSSLLLGRSSSPSHARLTGGQYTTGPVYCSRLILRDPGSQRDRQDQVVVRALAQAPNVS